LLPIALEYLISQKYRKILLLIQKVDDGEKLNGFEQQELGMSKIVEHYLEYHFNGKGFITKQQALRIMNLREFQRYSDDNTNQLIKMLESYMPNEEDSNKDIDHNNEHRQDMDL